jgi:hypothetical protein
MAQSEIPVPEMRNRGIGRREEPEKDQNPVGQT